MNSFIKHYLKHQVAGYVDKRNRDLSRFERFDMGESFMVPQAQIRSLLKKYDWHKLNHYPDPTQWELRKVVAKNLKLRPENIILGAGAHEIILMIPRAFGEPGDSSVIAVPTFFTFAESNHAFKVRNHLVRLREDDDFAYDEKFVERFIQTIKKCCAKTAWLSSPNNPLGNVITREAVIKILRSIPQDCVLIVDEVFYDFYDPANRQSALGLIEQHKNLLVLRSLSKPYGLAGIRCGYAAGHQSLIKTLDILRPYFNLSAFSLDLAKAVLVDHGYIKKVVRITRREREKMFKVISRLENYHLGGQSVSNIFILKHKKRDLWQSLVRKNILAADFRQSLGLEGKGYVRLTVQSPEKNQKLLQVLKELN